MSLYIEGVVRGDGETKVPGSFCLAIKVTKAPKARFIDFTGPLARVQIEPQAFNPVF